MRSTIKQEKSGSFVGTALLVMFSLVLIINTLRVVVNGRNNYDTYLEEQKSLEKIQERNQELKEEKEYVTSEEYKLILLRDAARLAQGSETLYQIKSSPVYLDEEVKLLDITTKTNFFDWWLKLIF
jgi:hypothetical protein